MIHHALKPTVKNKSSTSKNSTAHSPAGFTAATPPQNHVARRPWSQEDPVSSGAIELSKLELGEDSESFEEVMAGLHAMVVRSLEKKAGAKLLCSCLLSFYKAMRSEIVGKGGDAGRGGGEGQILFSEYMILFPKQAKVGDMSLCIMIVYFFSDIFPLFSIPSP